MSTLMEQTSEKETKLLHNNQNDDEVEIDLMDLLRKVIGIRKKVYKAAGIGLVLLLQSVSLSSIRLKLLFLRKWVITKRVAYPVWLLPF